jgi:hypothetical protein
MPEIHVTIRAVVPEPGKDPRAQHKLWGEINTLLDATEASITALGGTMTSEALSKRTPKVSAPTPPPAVSVAPVADLVQVAEIGAAVAEAAKEPEPAFGAEGLVHPAAHAHGRSGGKVAA